MYNVLPEENKKSLKKEYALRLVTLVSWFVGAIIFSGTVLLIPSYVITLQKKAEFKGELAKINAKTDDVGKTDFANTTKELQEKLKILAVIPQEIYSPSNFFNNILGERGEAVTLSQFSYELIGTTTKVTIEGVAKSRDDLLSFKSRLEKTELFNQADFPIDLLVKTRNINFTIVLN